MDIREKAYHAVEAEAIRRQFMAMVAQAVAAGMAGGKHLAAFVRDLELTMSRSDIIQANWEALGVKLEVSNGVESGQHTGEVPPRHDAVDEE